MARAVRDGIRAGALGFTTSRTVAHRTRDGAPLGTRFSTADELLALVGAMGETGAGVVQMISDAYLSEDDEFAVEEMALMRSMVEHSGRPLSMTVQQVVQVPDRWRDMVAWVAAGVADGLDMRTQVAPRPVGVLQGLTASVNPIAICPSYRDIADRPLDERVAALRDPQRRARIVAEHPTTSGSALEGLASTIFTGFDKLFPMEEPVELRAAGVVERRRSGRGARRVAGRGDHRPHARGRWSSAADPHVVQLRQGQPRRRPRDVAVAELGDRSRRRRCPLRRDQRRQLPDDVPGPVDEPDGRRRARCRSS